MKFVFIVFALFAIVPPSLAFASESTFQRRQFAGGIDEEDLRVQPQWIAPQRRLDQKVVQDQVLKLSGRSEVSEDASPDSAGHD
jgi:hypothetical protein